MVSAFSKVLSIIDSVRFPGSGLIAFHNFKLLFGKPATKVVIFICSFSSSTFSLFDCCPTIIHLAVFCRVTRRLLPFFAIQLFLIRRLQSVLLKFLLILPAFCFHLVHFLCQFWVSQVSYYPAKIFLLADSLVFHSYTI